MFQGEIGNLKCTVTETKKKEKKVLFFHFHPLKNKTPKIEKKGKSQSACYQE